MNPFDQRLDPVGPLPFALIAVPARAALLGTQFGAAGRAPATMIGLGEQVPDDARLVVADVAGCVRDEVDALLATVDAIDPAVPVLVLLTFDQVDAVVAGVTRDDVRFLCDPTEAEFLRATSGGDGHVREQGDDSEAERLRRIDEEVARIARVLARLTAGREAPGALGDRELAYDPGPPRTGAGAPVTVNSALVRRIIRARRLRDQHFDATLFADPAWDMLLDLYAAELDRGQVSVSSLCIAAAVPPTTALRWITSMTARGLFVRTADPFDKRRIFIALGTSASAAMRSYFAALIRQGLPLVG